MKHESKAGIIGRRWFEDVWSKRRDDLVDELMTPDSIGHVEGGEYRGPEGFRQMREMFLSALPDVHIDVEDVISDGDRAAVRWRARGTHTGHGFGFAPTHERIDVRGTTWLVVHGDKIVEGWDTWNLEGMLSSLRTAAEKKSRA
jgi:predicted ester cyclase